ncbi:unnamed protein product [Brassica rapa subsp. narinosa]|uniref:(rape) hypothetical protein n=1 Tax=Brassica napus TaxID=3708 RepID=A0A816Y520_BRANA|nr:unnamed protein product [Brassica napus]
MEVENIVDTQEHHLSVTQPAQSTHTQPAQPTHKRARRASRARCPKHVCKIHTSKCWVDFH